ncbi:MAG: SpvB/TcaC N-terminal domain-containing protein [Desulfocapsaceae bacterium]|nr:SpvB/TcaC N-terminal domain-containing protein [Desulfocapsaceae bacterium]
MFDSKTDKGSIKESEENKNQIHSPSINLPKGGGAIRGMGEKFAANPVTGTGSMSIPISTSPGRSGFGPQLSLSYDSGSGNGPFGFGWSLSLPSIIRKTDKGLPRYFDAHGSENQDSDVFILSGAEDLVPVYQQNADNSWKCDAQGELVVYEDEIDGYHVRRYRPRIEGLFARIERWTKAADPSDIHWRSLSKDNILTLYGKDANSRIVDPEDPLHIFSWLICETRDDKGNAVIYAYKLEDGAGVDLSNAHERNRGELTESKRTANRYLKRIQYGNRTTLLDSAGKRPRFLTGAELQLADWMFEVVLDYGEHDADKPGPNDTGQWQCRLDPFSSYRAGFEVRTYRRCQRVLMYHHFADEADIGKDCVVRSTDFHYSCEPNPVDAKNRIYSFLLSVKQCGYKRNNDGYRIRSLPPVEFEYSRPIVEARVHEVDPASLENLPVGLDGSAYQWTDLHGEGIPGILTEQGGAWYYKRNLSPINVQPDGSQTYTEAQFAPIEQVAVKPNLTLAGGAQFMDLAGNGQPDLAVLDGPMPGFYEHDDAEGWQPFRPFTARLNRDMRDQNLKFIDLDGDGHADVLITEDDALIWHASLAEEGFGPALWVAQALNEEKGPRLVFADSTQSIYLADLSGDGLTDLVRIRNGEVCYWPNLGYCRFGAKVTMDNAPWFDNPDQFDHKRIRVADIDGSGTTDIIYLHSDGVRLYFNQSGNGWSQPERLSVSFRVDDLASIIPTDLLGNGTACLVWSSPLPGDTGRQMRYINLMGEQKPHLLIKTINNLGAETRVSYAPSTKFYLQDKRDGKPWITKLPFPVHVVERVETIDWISRNRFSTRYAYHHGYFDGAEREFRGFGMVEQWDTEEYSAIGGNDNFLISTNIDQASHIPPVHTKTWFHIGVYLGGLENSLLFAREYYGAPSLADPEFDKHFDAFVTDRLLPDTILDSGLPMEETREACRSLKGAMLRQEVYADDGSDKACHPYTVTEQNFTIKRLQPRADNRHAVFFTHAREAISYHYERDQDDPRIGHELTLDVDEFGDVLKSAAIGYGREKDISEGALQPKDQEKQKLIHITYTENIFTNPIIDEDDVYRTPLPAATRTYELRKPEQEQSGNGPTKRYRFEEMVEYTTQAGDGNHDIAYEDHQFAKAKEAAATSASEANNYFRRLIEQVRTLYRADDLAGPLALGELQSLALPYESYKLAFTPGLLEKIYQRPKAGQPTENLLPEDPGVILVVDEPGAAITGRGGYVQLDGDSYWWIPSGQIFFSPEATDTPAVELDAARQCFFTPRRYQDPFGHSTTVSFDYCLLVRETRDALGNTVLADNDFRVLQPWRMTDPNGNRTMVVFDALGMVAGTAVMGKADETLGDTLDGFEPDLSAAQVDTFFNAEDPHDPASMLLVKATTRIIYDLDCFRSSRESYPDDPTRWLPTFAATLARETHVSDPLPPEGLKIQIGFSYSDGFGREIQKKIQAEPGPLVGDGPVLSPRWVGSGWTIFNNKGKPVRKYEPFFSPTHGFEFGVQVGVSPILFYDPAGRVVATLYPNHTYEKVVFDPWHQTTYDGNDTCAPRNSQTGDPRTDPDIGGYVAEYFKTQSNTWQSWHAQCVSGDLGEAEKQAALKAEAHSDTPTIAHFDSLGRPFLTLAHNRVSCADHTLNGTEASFATWVELDIEGNQRTVSDAKDRVVMRYDYDMLGNVIHQASMEAGARWILNDVAGQSLHAWDDRSHHFWSEYEAMHRPVHQYVRGHDDEHSDPCTLTSDILIQKIEYGEGQANATELNLRTRAYKSYDNAGVVTSEAYDFKGNLLNGHRRLTVDYKDLPDWAQDVPLESDAAGQPQRYATSIRYDALNRPVEAVSPDGSISRPAYNEANLLERLEVNLRGAAAATPFVTNIDYDAKGQRTRIDYGNNATTRYDYDPLTFRLTRLLTTRPTQENGLAGMLFKTTDKIQDLRYTYDPVGNITRIADEALQVNHYDNQKVEPVAHYTYDALYRLLEAQGRERIGQTALQLARADGNYRDHQFTGFGPQANDPLAIREYTERYEYDSVGNFLSFIHRASNGNWQRDYGYEEPSLLAKPGEVVYSNRLSRTILHPNGNNPFVEHYTYDPHGNMTKMGHLPLMLWDRHDQLRASSRQVATNGGTPVITYYVYDAGGQRVRKITEGYEAAGGTPTRKKERIYLGGFEIYREYNGDGTTCTLERETLHVMDDKQRIGLVETKTSGVGHPGESNDPLIRYQLGNHLSSASLELDRDGAVISYEEYHPYGTTAFQAYRSGAETSLKRYRHTGMERDEETGLNYHSARYYAVWLGRWVSCDPVGLVDGTNLFVYGASKPVVFTDRNGTDITFEVDDERYRKDVPGEAGAKRLHLAGLTMARKIEQQLETYFGIAVDVRTETADKDKDRKTVLSLSKDEARIANAMRVFRSNLIAELKVGEPGKSDSYYEAKAQETEQKLGGARAALKEMVEDYGTVKLGTHYPNTRGAPNLDSPVAYGQTVDTNPFSDYTVINPFSWFQETAPGSRSFPLFDYAVSGSSEGAKVRMGPLLLLFHEFQHEDKGIENEEEVVKKIDQLIEAHPSIEQRGHYSSPTGGKYYFKNPMHWVDVIEGARLTHGI